MKAFIVMMVMAAVAVAGMNDPYEWPDSYNDDWAFVEWQINENWELDVHYIFTGTYLDDITFFVFIQRPGQEEYQVIAIQSDSTTNYDHKDHFAEGQWGYGGSLTHANDVDLGGENNITDTNQDEDTGSLGGIFTIPMDSSDPAFDVLLEWEASYQFRCGYSYGGWEGNIVNWTADKTIEMPDESQDLSPSTWASIKAAF